MGFVAFQRVDVSADAKPTEKPVERFMKQKLIHSQDVLEGLVTEDFAQIEKAAEMHTLSQAAEWQVLRTPTYDLSSKEFQTACSQLEKAAKEKNTDGASLAWIRVPMTCLSCHKHVRSVKSQKCRWIPKFRPPYVWQTYGKFVSHSERILLIDLHPIFKRNSYAPFISLFEGRCVVAVPWRGRKPH